MERQRGLFDGEAEPWLRDAAADFAVARVVFAEAPFGPYDYRVPDSLREQVRLGVRVEVPLGRGGRRMQAYCIEVLTGDQLPEAFDRHRLKEVVGVLDERPLLDAAAIRLASWMADRYITPLGTVIETILPAGVRMLAGTREVTRLTISPAGRAALASPKGLAPKQRRVLELAAEQRHSIAPADLASAAGCTLAPVRSLRERGFLQASLERTEVGEPDLGDERRDTPWTPNEDQSRVLESLHHSIHSGKHETILLHGVTGSGKTEVYMQAIQEVIRLGRQAIVLVPEISLTPQTRNRFRARFPQVAVLHSHLSPVERHQHWRRIASGEIQVVVGARSAVFAPTKHLGLIVIDEEHDGSFKQDKAPRYHARDVARQRCETLGIPLILGTATPSLESWYDSLCGRSRRLSLPRRVRDLPLPDVVLVDLRSEFKSRGSRGMISRPLHQRVRATLAEEGQVILLLNRRGFATSVQCPACGFVLQCPHCELSLTHHKDGAKAVCHYCDYLVPEPKVCPDCGFEGIRFAGYGTQKLELEVSQKFPDVPFLRMDGDTMRQHGSHEVALERFRAGEAKILLGTQMIAKGLDFPNVMLVGVINADTALHFPDFRASERTFALVTQVAGRTGRGDRGGQVVVQTFSPEHPALVAARHHDFEAFAAGELPERERLGYPPYGTLARMVVRAPQESQAEAFADQIASLLRRRIEPSAGERNRYRVVGPAPCPIPKLRDYFRFHLLLQGLDGSPLPSLIRTATDSLVSPADVQWIVDIDPADLL